jgi:hypothetical protein
VVVARTFLGQLLGFIPRRHPWPGGALGIPRCGRVHTFGVNRPLDVIFCDRDGRTVRVVAALVPNRLSPPAPGAYWAWEADAGTLAAHVKPGDIVVLTAALAATEPSDTSNGGE